EMTRIIFPMVLLTSLSALCNGVLHSYNHFYAPAAAWNLHNIGIITLGILLYKKFDIFSLCFGVLAGALSMVLVQIPVIYWKGFLYSRVIDLKHPGVKKILRLFLPAMLGLSITQINLMLVPVFFGSYFGEGVVTALHYAIRLLLLPLGMFGNALSMAIFPALSRHAGADKRTEFRATFVRGINATFVFSLPSTVLFVILGLPITRLLFEGNKFTAADCEATAFALIFFSVGLVGHTALQVIARGFYALQDTTAPFKTGLFSVLLVSLPGCILLTHTSLRYGGIALAISLSAIVNAVLLYILIARRIPELRTDQILSCFQRVASASLGMAIVCYYLKEYLAVYPIVIQVLVNMTISGGVFIVLATIFKVEEVQTLLRSIRSFIFRKGGAMKNG
ncbi:MAG: murein biosynthesis integral membrane protein MurJ, partial [bacterium]